MDEAIVVSVNGYIEHKVDFAEGLSEAVSNSWCEDVSISANDPNNVEDEDYGDENETKKKVKFDKDDGGGVVFK